MNIYATNHTHSRVICHALAEGCNGRIVPPVRLLDGPGVFFGILRGCGDLIKECGWVGRDFYYVDHGYFRRGYYDGHFRVSRNGLQVLQGGFSGGKRWQDLEIPLRPWKRTGRHIVVCPISPFMGQHLGIDPEEWTSAVVRELSLHTDRTIIVKPKDGEPLSKVLEDAWCLVTHSSNAAVDAITSGIPAVTLGESAAKEVSWSLEDIESPWWPERQEWCETLADNQFTLDEMRRDLPRLS